MSGDTASIEQLRQATTVNELLACLDAWNEQPALCRIKPADAAFAHTLVEAVLPHLWTDDAPAELTNAIVKALSSLAGVNALLRNLRTKLELDMLQNVLAAQCFSLSHIHDAWFRSGQLKDISSQQLWSSYVSLMTGSKLLNSLALHKDTLPIADYWFSSSLGITRYLSKLIMKLILSYKVRDTKTLNRAAVGYLISGLQSLGHADAFFSIMLDSIKQDMNAFIRFAECRREMEAAPATRLYQNLMAFLDKKYFQHTLTGSRIEDGDRIGAAGTLIKLFIEESKAPNIAQNWLLRQSTGTSLSLRRAVIAALYNTNGLAQLADTLFAVWADRTQIRHAGISARQTLIENVILVLGRLPSSAQSTLAKSVLVSEGISNHLESSSEAIRGHGMILAEVVTQFYGQNVKPMKFDLPATTGSEAAFLRSLLEVRDDLKDVSLLDCGSVTLPRDDPVPELSSAAEEVTNEKEEDDVRPGDIRPLRLPDSDDEDSDEDPTLLDREKIPPPLYIRTLIEQLLQHDNFKSIYSGLRHAPALIRRKAQYGSELSNYATQLAEILSGLKDNFDMEDFQELRQEALVALVAACPDKVGPFLSRAFFVADYSLQQRVIVLSALALGSHRLVDPDNTSGGQKQLPLALQQMFIEDTLSALMKSPPPKTQQSKTTWQAYILFPLLGNFHAYATQLMQPGVDTFYESMLLSYYVKSVSSVYALSGSCTDFKAMTGEVLQFALSLQSQRDSEVVMALATLVATILQVNDARVLAEHHSAALLALQDWSTRMFETTSESRSKALLAGISVKINQMAKEKMDLLMAGSYGAMETGTRFGLRGLQ
jgi:telomere length regulation protein